MFDFGFSEADDRFTAKVIFVLKTGVVFGTVLVGTLAAQYLMKPAPSVLPPPPRPISLVVAPPTHLLIKGKVWDVTFLAQKFFQTPDRDGQTDCDTNTIYVSTIDHGAIVRSTLLHELLHAGVCTYNPKSKSFFPDNDFYKQLPKESEAHPAIYAAEYVLAPILQDNPHLAAYLASKDTAEETQKLLGLPATEK